jgi:hypothetical protein
VVLDILIFVAAPGVRPQFVRGALIIEDGGFKMLRVELAASNRLFRERLRNLMKSPVPVRPNQNPTT